MKAGGKFAALAVVALTVNIIPAAGLEPAWTEKQVSPDGKIAFVQAWERDAGNYCEVTVHKGKKLLYKNIIHPESDVRYFKFSWSPDSRALLIGEGHKSDMDLTLVCFANGNALVTRFDGDKRIDTPMLAVLPFRDGLKNIAPVARVAWHTIKWVNDSHCEMIYIFRGIGYEGEAALRIDLDREGPVLNIMKITPILNPKNLNDT